MIKTLINTIVRRKVSIIVFAILVALSAKLVGITGDNPTKASGAEEEVDAVIDAFQTAYSNKKTYDLRMLFYSDAVIAHDSHGGERQAVYALESWIQGTDREVFAMNDYISDELTNREITVLRNIAYVVCDYTYRDDDSIQKGVDIFTLMKKDGKWKILSLQWTGDSVK